MDQQELLREAAEDFLLQESHRRRFLYRDVEELIEVGFLTQTLNLGESTLTLRSLVPQELVRVQVRIANVKQASQISRWLLASSIWMVDGLEVSRDPSQNGAYHLYHDLVKDMPEGYVEALSATVTGLRNRCQRAAHLLEAFCYEPYSRSLWRMLDHRVPEDASIVRRLWVAFNISEDRSRDVDAQWYQTRAIVSSLSNKGGSELGRLLQQGEEKEENRRKKVIEDTVNWIIRGERKDQEEVTVTVNGQQVKVPNVRSAQTVEELQEEMRKVATGEKDFHDLQIEEYHRQIRERMQRQREAREELIRRSQAKYAAQEALLPEGSPALVGYTPEQLRELNPRIAAGPRTTAVVPESAQTAYIYERYFHKETKAGALGPGMKVVDADPRAPTETEPAPEKPSLQDQVRARVPTLKSEG